MQKRSFQCKMEVEDLARSYSPSENTQVSGLGSSVAAAVGADSGGFSLAGPSGEGVNVTHKLPVLSAGDVERLSGIPCLSPTITLVRMFVRNKVVSSLCMQHSICRIVPFVYIQQQYRDCMDLFGSSVFASTESLRGNWMITEEPLFTLLLVSG